MKVCAECRAEIDKWDHPSVELYQQLIPFKIHSGAVYDDTVRGVIDNRRHTADKFYDLCNSQVRLIYKICEENHQTHERGEQW